MLNIYGFLTEQIDFERLIEEGKDPVEILKYKYQDVPSDIIDHIISIDPTKKKSYSQWVLSKWNDESSSIVKYLKNGKLSRLFSFLKKQNAVQAKSFPSVAGAVEMYVPDYPVWHKSKEPTVYVDNIKKEVSSELANDFDILYSSDEWMVIVPNTYEAECQLAEGMHWCTANAFGNGKSYYRQYLNDYGGKYYVNVDLRKGETSHDNGKEYPYTRYQFHFESNQYKDQYDNQIQIEDIDIPEELYEFYENEGYDLNDCRDEETIYEYYMEQRYNDGYCITPGLLMFPEFDHDYVYHEPDADTEYFIFDDEDNEDPIDYRAFKNPLHHNDVFVVQNPDRYYIMNDAKGERVILIRDINYRERGYNTREWGVYDLIGDYVEVADCVFGITTNPAENKKAFCLFSTNGNTYINNIDIEADSDFKIELRGEDEEGNCYIETIGKYHSLFVVSPDRGAGEFIECIVKADIPKNGERFVVNENGVIEGKFKNYRLDGEYSEEEKNFEDYGISSEISGNVYIVRNTKTDGYNIFLKDTGSLAIDTDEPFIKHVNGGFIVYSTDGDIFILTDSIKRVEGKYIKCYEDKADSGYLIGTNGDGYHFIHTESGKITASFDELMAVAKEHNIVIVKDEFGTKFFDIANNKFVLNDISIDYKIYNTVFCKGRLEGYIAINYRTMTTFADGITSVDKSKSDLYPTITLENGKQNLIDTFKGTKFFENDVDKIIHADLSRQGVVVYENDGKGFICNGQGTIISNPNGYQYDVEFNIYSRSLVFSAQNIELSVVVEDNKLKPYEYFKDGKEGEDMNARNPAPREIKEMYKNITGEDLPEQYGGGPGNDETENVRENFSRCLRRIEEAWRKMI